MQPGTPNLPVPTSSGNRRVAVRDAERMLALAVLPPGAVRLSAAPHGDDRLLAKPPQEPSGDLVDRHGWWEVPAPLASVLAFLQANRPPGSRPSGSGQEGGPGVPANEMVSFSFPPVSGVVSARSLTLDAVTLSGGGTGIRVDAQVTWVLARSAHERVPAGVHVVKVTSARPGAPAIVSVSVTAPRTVGRIVSLVDRMSTVQPGAYSCPALMAGKPVVTFAFQAAAGLPVLAQASLTDYGFGSGPCNPVSFSIGGRAQKPLIGGSFLAEVQRLLGVRFL